MIVTRFPRWSITQRRFEENALTLQLESWTQDGILALDLWIYRVSSWYTKPANTSYMANYALRLSDLASSTRHPFLGTLHQPRTRHVNLSIENNLRSVTALFYARLADGVFTRELPCFAGPDAWGQVDLVKWAQIWLPYFQDSSLTVLNSAEIASSSAFF